MTERPEPRPLYSGSGDIDPSAAKSSITSEINELVKSTRSPVPHACVLQVCSKCSCALLRVYRRSNRIYTVCSACGDMALLTGNDD